MTQIIELVNKDIKLLLFTSIFQDKWWNNKHVKQRHKWYQKINWTSRYENYNVWHEICLFGLKTEEVLQKKKIGGLEYLPKMKQCVKTMKKVNVSLVSWRTTSSGLPHVQLELRKKKRQEAKEENRLEEIMAEMLPVWWTIIPQTQEVNEFQVQKTWGKQHKSTS